MRRARAAPCRARAGGAPSSRGVPPAVPRALAGLTSGFGMGPGGPPPPRPPARAGRGGGRGPGASVLERLSRAPVGAPWGPHSASRERLLALGARAPARLGAGRASAY